MAVAGRHLQGHASESKMDMDTGMEVDNPTIDSAWHKAIKYKVAKSTVIKDQVPAPEAPIQNKRKGMTVAPEKGKRRLSPKA